MAELPRTMFAQKALDLAQLFKITLGEKPIVSGKTSYELQMSTPEGPSTGAGVQGVQHITLKPQTGGESVVIGSANKTTMSAQLRTFDLLRDIHVRRSPGVDFGLDAEIYRDVHTRLNEFFQSQGMKLSDEDIAARAATPEASPNTPFPVTLVLAAGAALVVLGIAAWFIMNRGH